MANEVDRQTRPEQPPDSGTKQKIIEAAREEFARFGFAGARVDRIAQRASVNKAMLYYHFQSKENLYEAVLKDFFTIISGRISRHIATAVSMEQALAGLVGIHAEVVAEFPHLRPIMLRELAEPHGSILDWFAETMSSSGFTKAARAGMEVQMQTGLFRQIDLRQAMISFVTMSLGYHLMAPLVDRVWNVDDREAFIEERKKAIVDLFLYGVKAR
jgi:TetR/AcrR family transcriptional regulator